MRAEAHFPHYCHFTFPFRPQINAFPVFDPHLLSGARIFHETRWLCCLLCPFTTTTPPAKQTPRFSVCFGRSAHYISRWNIFHINMWHVLHRKCQKSGIFWVGYSSECHRYIKLSRDRYIFALAKIHLHKTYAEATRVKNTDFHDRKSKYCLLNYRMYITCIYYYIHSYNVRISKYRKKIWTVYRQWKTINWTLDNWTCQLVARQLDAYVIWSGKSIGRVRQSNVKQLDAHQSDAQQLLNANKKNYTQSVTGLSRVLHPSLFEAVLNINLCFTYTLIHLCFKCRCRTYLLI